MNKLGNRVGGKKLTRFKHSLRSSSPALLYLRYVFWTCIAANDDLCENLVVAHTAKKKRKKSWGKRRRRIKRPAMHARFENLSDR
jgi:hypothetical protein